MSTNVKLSDINPLEHVTGDIAISQYNYESIMNGLVQWNMSKMDNVTIRVATRTEPYFVDYVIPTKYFYDRTYGGLASDKFLPAGGYAYVNREKLSVAKDDNMSIRVNVDDRGDTLWAIYADVTTYDEYDRTASNDGTVTLSVPSKYKHDYVEGLYVRGYDTSSHKFRLLATTGDIVAGSTSTYSLTKDIVVEVQSNRNCDTHGIDKVVNHIYNYLVATHVLSSTLRCLDHNRCVCLLNSSQDALCPLEVVCVERRNCVVTLVSLVDHFCCRN